jgi:hypothetical protein
MVVNNKDLNKGSMRPASEDFTACPYSRAGLLQLVGTWALRQLVQLLLQPRKVSYERCAVSDMTRAKASDLCYSLNNFEVCSQQVRDVDV